MLMLLFQLGEEHFALDSKYVLDIFPNVFLQKIHHRENYVAGLLNYGGIPIPVVDLSLLIVKRPSRNSLHTRIMLLEDIDSNNGSLKVGAIAEQVTDMLEIEKEKFVNTGMKFDQFSFLGGIHPDQEKCLQLFQVDEFFKFIRKDIVG